MMRRVESDGEDYPVCMGMRLCEKSHIGTSTWGSEDYGGSAQEPQKNHRTLRGDRREQEE